MVARLVSEVTGDAATVRAMAARLDFAQRQGLRALPSPLPSVPEIDALYGSLRLTDRDRDLLLAVALHLSDSLEPILAIDGRTAAELAVSPVGDLIEMHAGRIRLIDPRLGIWLQASTAPSDTVALHTRLHHVFLSRREQVCADWHAARSSTSRSPVAASALTRTARVLAQTGKNVRAFQIAGEAAAHTSGAERDEATLVAGVSAIAAGHAVEAVRLLVGLYPDATERHRLQGLGSLLVAQAFVRGAVPELDAHAFAPRTDDRDDWYSWTRAAALAAFLCAERGDRRGMRAWLDAMREGSAKVGADRCLRDPVVALSWLVLGDRDIDDAPGTGPLSRGILGALHAGMDGDIDRGLRLLAAWDTGMDEEVDPLVAGCERSPLVAAYRAVVEVLLLMWRGDIGAARIRMMRAAVALPVALPFAGLGVVISRRLDLAVLGRLGPFARALTASLPAPQRIDRLVDRGIEAFLAGDEEEAIALMRLWHDRGAPRPSLSVPGLEESSIETDDDPPRSAPIEPPEITLARGLRSRILNLPAEEWQTERASISAVARTLRSPFTRGRVEAMIGIRSIRDGEIRIGREYLADARHLLEVSGATAWTRAVECRIDRVDAAETAPSAKDPLSSSRRAWEAQLTARELEVAMLVVEGASNRDIADALHVSVRTVEVHLGRVFGKLDVRTRVELTVLAHRIGG
ncbi:LuxR family transcriptional regulator [Microbacterium foliorum]|uniref:Transcriptional regulatory protein LiaR n=1 Tax=Microbacterium foliorum TaxID=104336 RepID=A0A0F0KAS4_9MICO|nr:helix-turn-helix transcriptional regulator [Microbacterium foliorum]AXL11877.1 LuxR family transcriptional regulator [Microbacterium foliorum]KJL17978.1 Transcriptional regulatory protein LiaR [Microbacterium foliorum]